MKTLQLDGSTWSGEEDFYIAFLAAVEAPHWHGHNLDALRDSIAAGGINRIEPPFRLIIHGSTRWPAELASFVQRVESVFHDAKVEGVPVEISVS